MPRVSPRSECFSEYQTPYSVNIVATHHRPMDFIVYTVRIVHGCRSPLHEKGFHPCPHATVSWSPLVGGRRQYFVDWLNLELPGYSEQVRW